MVILLLKIFLIIIDQIDDHLLNQYLQQFVYFIFFSTEIIICFFVLNFLATNSSSALERRYRICSTLLDHPPSLPSPPLAIESNDKLSNLLIKDEINDIRDDESIISTSTLADDENIQHDNIELLKTLSSNNDLRSLSPVLISNDILPTKNSDSSTQLLTSNMPIVDIKKEPNDITATSAPPGGNELDKKDRPLVEGTDKVKPFYLNNI